MTFDEDKDFVEDPIRSLETVLARLERATLNVKGKTPPGEQADYVRELENQNRSLMRDLEAASARISTLEETNKEIEQDVTATISEVDQLISQIGVH